jgi:hypothetical protein
MHTERRSKQEQNQNQTQKCRTINTKQKQLRPLCKYMQSTNILIKPRSIETVIECPFASDKAYSM